MQERERIDLHSLKSWSQSWANVSLHNKQSKLGQKHLCNCVSSQECFNFSLLKTKEETPEQSCLCISYRGCSISFCFKLMLRLEGYLNQNIRRLLFLQWKCFIFSWPKFWPKSHFFLLFSHEKTKQNWKFISSISETNLFFKSLCWTKVLLNKQIKMIKLTITVDSPIREWIPGLQLRWLWFLFQWCFEVLWILEI